MLATAITKLRAHTAAYDRAYSRTSTDAPLPPGLSVALAGEPAGIAMLDAHRDLGDWTATAKCWSEYRQRLAQNRGQRWSSRGRGLVCLLWTESGLRCGE